MHPSYIEIHKWRIMNEIRLENERKSESVIKGDRRRKSLNQSEKAVGGMEEKTEKADETVNSKESTLNTYKGMLSTWIPFL